MYVKYMYIYTIHSTPLPIIWTCELVHILVLRRTRVYIYIYIYICVCVLYAICIYVRA